MGLFFIAGVVFFSSSIMSREFDQRLKQDSDESDKHSPEFLTVPVQIFILNFLAIIIAIILFTCRQYLITNEMNFIQMETNARQKELNSTERSNRNVHSKNSGSHRYTVRRKCRKSPSQNENQKTIMKSKPILTKSKKSKIRM